MKFYDYRKWAWEQPIKPSNRKFVLVCISEFSDEKGSCYPRIETIAEMVNQGNSTVREHIKKLCDEGYLTRQRLRRSDGSLAQYRYFIQCQNSAVGENPSADFAPSLAPALPLHHRQDSADNNNHITTNKQPKMDLVDEVFEKLWKYIQGISPKSKRSRHSKKASHKKFRALCVDKTRPDYTPGKIAHSVMWFYDQDDQKKSDRDFIKGLQAVLNQELFESFLGDGQFSRAQTRQEEIDGDWARRINHLNQTGDWPASAPSPKTMPLQYREMVKPELRNEIFKGG